MDADLIRTQIRGLEASIKSLREREAAQLRRQGIRAQIEKLTAEYERLKEQAQEEKKRNTDLVAQKNATLGAITGKITDRMNAVLPVGTAIIEITADQKFNLGWEIDGIMRPYKALSGGEKTSFDCAIALALGANVIIQEAAELDETRMVASLEKLGETDCQVICMACYPVKEVPEPWKMVQL